MFQIPLCGLKFLWADIALGVFHPVIGGDHRLLVPDGIVP
jgi:hypothetical protein